MLVQANQTKQNILVLLWARRWWPEAMAWLRCSVWPSTAVSLETVKDDTFANTRNSLVVFLSSIITDHAQRFVCCLRVRPDGHASGCGVACQNIEPVNSSSALYLRDVILRLVLKVWLSVESLIC